MSNNKYEKAKIYKIWSTQGDKIYIGSTCKDYLSQRMTMHRSDYQKWKRGTRRYTTSFSLFDEFGLENCFIELLESKSCCSKDELMQLEGKYIRELECVNKISPYRTKEQISEYNQKYRNNNKDKRCIYNKEYRQNNKDYISEQKKQKHDCECGGKFTQDNKSKHLKTVMHCQFIESKKQLIE